MSEITTVTNRKVLKVHNDLNMGRYSLSQVEMNIIYKMITEIDKEDKDFKDYIFKVTDLEKFLGVDLKRNDLKKIAENILRNPLKIKREDGGFLVIGWLSSFEYKPKEGNIYLSFDPKLKPYLLDMKEKFLKLNFENLFKINSSYGKRIYSIIKQNCFEKVDYKFIISVQELQDILMVPKSLKLFGNFKKDVLEISKKEINDKTDIKIEYREIKTGRKVTELEFSIVNILELEKSTKKNSENYELNNFKMWFKKEYKDYREEIIQYKDKFISLTEDGYFNAIAEFYKFSKIEIDEIWNLLYLNKTYYEDYIAKIKAKKR